MEKPGKIRVNLWTVCGAMAGLGLLAFFIQMLSRHPERAWQAYLINFLLFSAIAQGGLLFSAVMHLAKAKWSRPLENIAESFSAFFPVSFVLFLGLFLGGEHVFPWLHHELGGKAAWLNLPFLFVRDLFALVVLYALGFGYLFHSLGPKLKPGKQGGGFLAPLVERVRGAYTGNEKKWKSRQSVWAVLYSLAFAFVVSLLGYDLLMAADPHWVSTLFGAYCFVTAFYVGLGGVIILAAVLHLSQGVDFRLADVQFLDVGKLFFGFCMVWADFFYCQLVVIWYGNIPDDAAYLIRRVMLPPYNLLAWTVFILCFIAPFLILINRRIKTRPKAMVFICGMVIVGIWLAHFLLLGPALSHDPTRIALGPVDVFVFAGFLGALAACLAGYFKLFPEMIRPQRKRAV